MSRRECRVVVFVAGLAVLGLAGCTPYTAPRVVCTRPPAPPIIIVEVPPCPLPPHQVPGPTGGGKTPRHEPLDRTPRDTTVAQKTPREQVASVTPDQPRGGTRADRGGSRGPVRKR